MTDHVSLPWRRTRAASSGALAVFEAGDDRILPPIVALHGFAGTHRSWDEVVAAISPSRRVIAPDLPGHGASSEVDAKSFEQAATALEAALAASDVDGHDLLGYSMGGRLALYVALRGRARVRRLILESASPGLATPAERRARCETDAVLAAQARDEGVECFVDAWDRTPVLRVVRDVDSARVRARRAMRLTCTAEGLASSLEGMGTGSGPWLGDELAGLDVPTLVVSGEADEKFTRIAGSMAAAIPDARHEIVTRCGHNTHFEAPDEVGAMVRDFIERDDARAEIVSTGDSI